jgi:murein DD-endopeptidase
MYEKHIYPCVKAYRISSKFGNRIHPVTKKESFHNGVDIATPSGTLLKNTVSIGKCTKVGYDDLNGHYLRIEHDNGLLTSYAHLSKVIAKEGEQIDLGEVFALTGNTGRSTGAHLHFRVRFKFATGYADVDPEKYFTF